VTDSEISWDSCWNLILCSVQNASQNTINIIYIYLLFVPLCSKNYLVCFFSSEPSISIFSVSRRQTADIKSLFYCYIWQVIMLILCIRECLCPHSYGAHSLVLFTKQNCQDDMALNVLFYFLLFLFKPQWLKLFANKVSASFNYKEDCSVLSHRLKCFTMI
jgi:hypothetical protein